MSETLVKSYQLVNEDGEIQNKFLYFPGQPRDYRFDARSGTFKIGESKPVMNGSKPAKSFTFQPFAFRKGTAIMFGREKVEKWIELFFVDAKNCVSAILFSSTNVEPFEKFMLEECLYEGLSLTDFVLTATPTEVVSKKDPNKKWFVCKIEGELADKELVSQLEEFDKDNKVFRADSVKDGFDYSMVRSAYFDSIVEDQKYIEVDETLSLEQ